MTHGLDDFGNCFAAEADVLLTTTMRVEAVAYGLLCDAFSSSSCACASAAKRESAVTCSRKSCTSRSFSALFRASSISTVRICLFRNPPDREQRRQRQKRMFPGGDER